MLHKANTLAGYTLHSLDGEIGKVKEFYFDDQHWTIRYLIVDTGDWLMSRKVLLSPYALSAITEAEKYITVDLTKKQIEASPSLDSDKPVSQQFEEEYFDYYGWPMYWTGPYMWGNYPYITRDIVSWKEFSPTTDNTETNNAWDPHLRSTHDVSGHHIQANDGEIGNVSDFIIDDKSWAIRYFIVDTGNWWPGKKVLVSPKWIERISWPDAKVFVALSRKGIAQSPEYSAASLITRDYETELHRHYQRPGYWDEDTLATHHSG